LASRECARQPLLAESVLAQKPASPALTMVSARGGEREEALTGVLHRLVAQPTDQAATPIRSAVLASVAKWRTA